MVSVKNLIPILTADFQVTSVIRAPQLISVIVGNRQRERSKNKSVRKSNLVKIHAESKIKLTKDITYSEILPTVNNKIPSFLILNVRSLAKEMVSVQ
jgi:hypothetical protein